MSFEIHKLRERLTTVSHEINKLEDKILFLSENNDIRLKQKESSVKHGWKWENVYQLGLEQTELQIKIHEAEIAKLVNEVKFLRMDIQEKKEKLNPEA